MNCIAVRSCARALLFTSGLVVSLAIGGCGPDSTGGEGLGDASNPQAFGPTTGGGGTADREPFADDRNLDRTLDDPDAAADLSSPAGASGRSTTPRADGWDGGSASSDATRGDRGDRGDRGGRGTERDSSDSSTGAAATAAAPSPGAGSSMGSASQGSGGGWAIPLATYSLENHRQTAMAFRAQFQAETGLTQSWIDTSRSDRSIVWYGQY
ncbi:MAG: hypothetical protein ACOC0P_05440, partial [Planctomycetota bacterium]